MSSSNTVISPQQISLRNVLLATDFAASSSLPVQYALSLVRRYGATLYLAHVVRFDPLHRSDTASMRGAVDQAWRDGQHLTTDMLVSGELRGIPHKLLVGEGEVWEGLAPMVRENNIDVIVTGTRGRSGLSKILFGSVAEKIFRQAPCPVITVGPNSAAPTGEHALEKILYATDFTPQSFHAASYAVSLAQHYRAHMGLLHVLPEEEGASARYGEEEAQTRLSLLMGSESGLTYPPEIFVGRGTAEAQILHFAERYAAQLIVLGVTHPGEGSFAGRRWSVASQVAGRALCPVLTARAPSEH